MLAVLRPLPKIMSTFSRCLHLGLVACLTGCASTSLDSTTQASIANIQISQNEPSNCQYLSEAVSFRISHKGYALDVFDTETQIENLHDQKLKLHARKLNANYVHTVYERNTGLANIVEVNTFYNCQGV